jgi:hypothetical protein
MELKVLLEKREAVILRQWLAMIFSIYPAGSTDLLKSEDIFTNPVVHNTKTYAKRILSGLIRGDNTAAVACYTEHIIRIRAVQDCTPSQATSFVTDLKAVIRSQIMHDAIKDGLMDDLAEFEKKIDVLGLISCDQYATIKSKIRELAIKKAKKDNDFKARIMGAGKTCEL